MPERRALPARATAPALSQAATTLDTRTPTRLCLAVLSALAYGSAFPPLGWFPLSWLALVPLLIALAGSGALRGFGIGLLWSLTVGVVTAPFLPEMIAEYFELPAPVTWLVAFVAVLATGLWYACFGAWLGSWTRVARVSPLFIAAMWGLCEWARITLGVPNPWALSGYSQVPWSTLMQNADWAGVLGIGMLVAGVNATVAGAFDRRLRSRRPWGAPVAVGCLVFGVLGYGSVQLLREFATGPEIELALIQPAIPEIHRFHPSHREQNLAKQLALSLEAAERAPVAIIWPENAMDYPLHPDGADLRILVRLAAATGADLLVGGPTPGPKLRPGANFNSLSLVRPSGLAGRYDKVDLMAFAEAPPLAGLEFLSEDSVVAGTSRVPLQTRLGATGVLLCNEIMFSGPARESVRAGADLLVNPANDGWFGARGAEQQLAIASVRAIETRRFVIRPALTGITAIIDAHGRVTERLSYGEAQRLAGRARRSQVTTLQIRWASSPVIAIGVLVAVVSLRAARSMRTSRKRTCVKSNGDGSTPARRS
jgi:apolipoprotein N-acyltransferase